MKTTLLLAISMLVLPVMGASNTNNGNNGVISSLRPTINDVAKKNNIDPVLIEAILRHESGHGTSSAARSKNNLAGIMGRKGQRSYASKEACVADLGRILAKYKSKGRVTTSQIGRVYCTTPGWDKAINAHMKEIRSGKRGDISIYSK